MKGRAYKIPESVLVVIHTSELEVLLIERADKPGYWQSVTGSKDRVDEPLVETCVREVAEETGIRLTADPVPGVTGSPPPPAHPLEGAGPPTVPLSALRDWRMSNVYEIYPVWRSRYAPGVTHNTEHVFGLTVPAGIAVTLNPREHLRHQWLPFLAAADRCFSPSNAEAILQLPRFAPPGARR
ncbi:MAG: dihydroneopterin triphosphate diphosphatase [Burkholderiaceae bacterium]|nr:dihydroneopterin triphosphate diphosphatase [Burkholderiaceae bacterium]